MPKLELNFLSCGLEPRFKLLITPVTRTYTYLAEAIGFEPMDQITPTNTLAGCRFRPLSHTSNNIFTFHYPVQLSIKRWLR